MMPYGWKLPSAAPPNGESFPQPTGLKLCQFDRCTKNAPAPMKTSSADIFNTTKTLFVVADSRMPIESTALSARTKIAAMTSYCECVKSQLVGIHHEPWSARLDCCAQIGIETPALLRMS